MATTFEWVELLLKNYKAVSLSFLFFLPSLGYTVNDNMNLTVEARAAEEQVTYVAEHLTNRLCEE